MKYFLFLLFFACTSIGFSQTEPKSFSNKYEEFDYYAKPSKTNKLSKYFRNRIDSNLLNPYKVNDTVENKKHIYLTFKINKENKATDINVNSPYFELNKSIREAFKNYDLEDLNIPDKSPLNIYTLQILSFEGDKMVVNCSTEIIYDRYPVFEGCETATSYYKTKSCINKLLEAHIAKNISPAVIKKSMKLGSLTLRPKFTINEKGIIELINSEIATDSLTKELNRVVVLFPNAKIPPTRNGKPTNIVFIGSVKLQIDSDNEQYVEEVFKSKDSTLSANSELALHFKKYIGEEELNKNFSRRIILSFSIDKNGQMIGVKANSNSPTFGNKILDIFKKFPFEKLNIKSTNVLELYSYTVVVKAYNNKNILYCSENPNVLIRAYFDKDCEKSKNPTELKDCFYQNVYQIIFRNFDRNLLTKTNLNGEVKIHCNFQVDDQGKIINVKVGAPNPVIANAFEQIIKEIPNAYKPAYFNGKAVISSFRITIPVRVGGKFDNPYRTELKDFD